MTAVSWMPPTSVSIVASSVEGNRANELTMLTDDFFQHIELLDLTRTADTGQYEYGTSKYASLNDNGGNLNGSLGYRIYRLDDDLATEYPIFIKIELYSAFGGPSVGYSIGSEITVGTQTDGTGSLKGITTSVKNVVGYPYQRNTKPSAYQSFASSVPLSGFVAVVYSPGNNFPDCGHRFAPVCFYIERIPNVDGTPSSLGFSLMAPNVWHNSYSGFGGIDNYQNNPVMGVYTILFNGNKFTNTAGIPYFSQGLLMSDMLIQHVYHSTPAPVRSNCVGGFRMPGVTKGTQFETAMYGELPRNYICLDGTASTHLTPQASLTPFFLFE
jgi:hypothetical protein